MQAKARTGYRPHRKPMHRLHNTIPLDGEAQVCVIPLRCGRPSHIILESNPTGRGAFSITESRYLPHTLPSRSTESHLLHKALAFENIWDINRSPAAKQPPYLSGQVITSGEKKNPKTSQQCNKLAIIRWKALNYALLRRILIWTSDLPPCKFQNGVFWQVYQ